MKVTSAILFVFVSLLASCEQEQKEHFFSGDMTDIPTHRSKSPVVYFMDSNRVKAVLHANAARVYEDRQRTYLDTNVVVEFMSRSTGKRVSILTANAVEVDDRTKDMTARGNVVVVSDSTQTTLHTQVLMWNNGRQKLHSTEFVHIKAPKETLEGYGFESDQNLENYVIYKVSGITSNLEKK